MTTETMLKGFNTDVTIKGYAALRGVEKTIRKRVADENKSAMSSAVAKLNVNLTDVFVGNIPTYTGHELKQNADFTFNYTLAEKVIPMSVILKHCDMQGLDLELFGYGLIRLAGGNDEWNFIVPSSRVMREWLEKVVGRKIKTQTMRHIAELFRATVKISKDGKVGYITVKELDVVNAIIHAFKLEGVYEVRYTHTETAKERSKRETNKALFGID